MALNSASFSCAAVLGIFTTFGTLFVALRLWTRFVILRAPGIEDWVIILSWLCAVITTVFIGLQIPAGLGEHIQNVSPAQTQDLLFRFYISISTYCASIGLTKLAILMQYQRVFPSPKFQIWCWAAIAIIIGYTVATVVAAIFVCTPIPVFWTGGPGFCINKTASWLANAIINIITDLMIIVLPMPLVTRLKLAPRQKHGLMLMFAIGVIVCVVSIVRLHSLLIASTSTDTTHDNATVATFSAVEINVSIICACVPTLRPLAARWISGLHISSNRTNEGYNSERRDTLGRQRSSTLNMGMPLKSLSFSHRGLKRLDDLNDSDDKIKVVTDIDIKVVQEDVRETSQESLFRHTHSNM